MKALLLTLTLLAATTAFAASPSHSHPRARAASPSIVISPPVAKVGTLLTVLGTGFDPGVAYTLLWGQPATGVIEASGATDGAGHINASFNVPHVLPGQQTVSAVESNTPTVYASTSFAVTPNLVLQQTSGLPGGLVAITGQGFWPNEPVNLYWNGTRTLLGVTYAGADGSLAWFVFRAPLLSYGYYSIDAVGQISHAEGMAQFFLSAKISIQPFVGQAGTNVVATGVGFRPNTVVDLFWGPPSIQPAAKVTANSSGSFTAPALAVPSNAPTGFGVVSAREQADAPVSTATFLVIPRGQAGLSLLALGGSPGAALSVEGVNFKAGENIALRWNRSTGKPLAMAVATSGGAFGPKAIALPTIHAGVYHLIAQGLTSHATASITYTIAYAPVLGLFSTIGAANLAHVIRIASGGGWAPHEPVRVLWNGKVVAHAMTDAFGQLPAGKISFTVAANTPAAVYNVIVRGVRSGAVATQVYTIKGFDPVAQISPAYGFPSSQPGATPTVVGTVITVKGYGFNPFEFVSVSFINNEGNPSEGQAYTDGSGTFSGIRFNTPAAQPGTNDNIQVVGDTSGALADAAYRVLFPPTGVVTPSSGPSATTVQVEGDRFSASETVQVEWVASGHLPTVLASITCDAAGHFQPTSVTLPAANPGSYTVALYGVSSTATVNLPYQVN